MFIWITTLSYYFIRIKRFIKFMWSKYILCGIIRSKRNSTIKCCCSIKTPTTRVRSVGCWTPRTRSHYYSASFSVSSSSSSVSVSKSKSNIPSNISLKFPPDIIIKGRIELILLLLIPLLPFIISDIII